MKTKSSSNMNLIILFLMLLCELVIFICFDDLFIVGYMACIFAIVYIVCICQNSNIMSPLIIFMGLYLFFLALGPLAYFINRNTVRHDISWLIIIGLIFFVMGYCFASNFSSVKQTTSLFKLNYNNEQTIKIIAIILLILSLIAQISFVLSNSALLFSNVISSGRIEATSGNGLITYMSGLWSFAACLLIELYLKKTRIEPYIVFLIFVSAILSLVRGFKSALLNFIFIILLMYNKRKKIKLQVVVLSIIGIMMFIILYNYAREGKQISDLEKMIFSAITDESYVGYINLQYVVECFPKRHDFMYGYGYIINIIMLGPGEDLDFTLTLKQILGLDFSGGGVTPTILGEFYLNYGHFGCIIGMFVLGMFYQKITKDLRNSESYYIPAWLAVTLCIAIRTGIANSEVTLLLNSIVYIFICWFSRHYRLSLK